MGNITTAEDALWWSFITITTVGYGDFYPVTNIGKLIAFILIVCGIATFGTTISYITEKASSFKEKMAKTIFVFLDGFLNQSFWKT